MFSRDKLTDLDGDYRNIQALLDGEEFCLEPSGYREILVRPRVTLAAAINKDLVFVTLSLPVCPEGVTEGKACFIKVLLCDGLWLPVINVVECQEDAGGHWGPQVAEWRLIAASEGLGWVKLNKSVKVVNFFVCINEVFSSLNQFVVVTDRSVWWGRCREAIQNWGERLGLGN